MTDEQRKASEDFTYGCELCTSSDLTVDPAAAEMLTIADELGISTMFSRAAEMKPCPIGAEGACCKLCAMGPCRISGKDKEGKTGVCGATLETIAARNFARMVAAGSSAHSDHGRDVAFTLKAVAEGEIEGMRVTDEVKLAKVARDFGIEIEGKDVSAIAGEVADVALSQFGQQTGELLFARRAPEKRQALWRNLGITPRGIDRDVVELLHRTNAGNDQDYEDILDASMKCALGDGWGGSMIATDLSDILFGTPEPVRSAANLGVLSPDQVNIVIHGHEPLLSSVIVQSTRKPEMIELAKSVGAAGINLVGICCTANENLMRQGVPPAGNMLHQELSIITGAVEAMVVDVQCVFQGLARTAEYFHTKLITTSEKAHIKGDGVVHIQVDEHRPVQAADEIVRRAIENFPNRGDIHIPTETGQLIAGFSHEYIRHMLGGKMRASLRPLNDNVMNGRIRGLAAVVGCNNPRTKQDAGIVHIVRELIANDVLCVVTGCAAIASGKYGLLAPETMEYAGDGLREVLETVGIPPVLHVGSCVDNSRILTVLSEVVEEGGLGEDISDLPAIGICPEWFSEKAIAIATYCVASGAYVIFGGVGSPVAASLELMDYMITGWEERVGGKLAFIQDHEAIVASALDTIDAKRAALKIDAPRERVLFDMEMRRELDV
ncbi:MAG: anaerobic carbon-monoxide dehydrogenase catalytic subunit [Coriobacteriia bacterium]|nr:anaerobic carbon-monoxide dehydrogenase catalytic subunit [Coriobacteriia bacterium]